MKKYENLCKKCMNNKGELSKCPFCGYIKNNNEKSNFSEKILQDKYIIGNKISESAESICYIGYDIKNDSKIHIREFFPFEICIRSNNGCTVEAKKSCNEKYENLKSDFLSYFRSIAKVRDIEAIVPVYDIFLDNGTAYVISEMIDGITLFELIKRNKNPLDWETAKVLFMPIISAFSRLSNPGILHLAINPKSLIIGKNGKMYIFDFSTPNLRQVGVFLNPEINKGFTAPEQYIKNYKLTQTADIYGLTATLFFALTGFPPKDAAEREYDERLLIPVKILKNIPPHVVSAISNGLKVNIQNRTQNFETLRDELTETSAKYLKEQDSYNLSNNHKLIKKFKIKNFWLIFCTIIVFLIMFSLIFMFYINKNNKKNKSQNDEFLLQSSSEVDDSVTVPNLVGKNFDDSLKDIDPSNYNILLAEKVFDDKFESGKITSQTPLPGISIKKGSNIIVSVSKGSKFKVLPQIEGLSLSQASITLTKNGFIPVQESQYNNRIEQGKIVGYKNHSSGEKVEVGSQVTIIVSKGKHL